VVPALTPRGRPVNGSRIQRRLRRRWAVRGLRSGQYGGLVTPHRPADVDDRPCQCAATDAPRDLP